MARTNRDKAKEVGIHWAEHMYQDLQDPRMRGQAFNWSLFPSMVANLAAASCYASFSGHTKHMPQLK
jgi:hypothetical protein